MCHPCCSRYADVYVEEAPRVVKRKHRSKVVTLQYQPHVPMILPSAPAPPAPVFYPGQPFFVPVPQYCQNAPDNPAPAVPAPAAAKPAPLIHGNVPLGMDLTGQEALARNIAVAHNSKVYEPQSFCPGDPDPLRMYWVRELDESWTLRNRLTIESGDIGDWTWYINTNDNTFYAVLKAKEVN